MHHHRDLSNIVTRQAEYISWISHPNTVVIDALLASSAIPGLWEPKENGTLVDGGLCDNTPIQYALSLSENNNYDKLVIIDIQDDRNYSKSTTATTTTASYIKTLISSLLSNVLKPNSLLRRGSMNTIILELPPMDYLSLNEETIMFRYNLGIRQCLRHFCSLDIINKE